MSLAVTDFGGTGELLVLGPSLGTTVDALWSAAATQLTAQFRVLGWDLPGHGASAPATGFGVADLAREVARLGERFRYAGVSIGGAVGLQLLLDAPGRVSAATLIGTGARIAEPAAWRERAARVRAEGMGFLVDESPARWFAPAHRGTTAAGRLLAELADVDAESYAAACEALAGFDVRGSLGEIAAPVLAVAGAHDPTTPPDTLREIADGVPLGRLVVLPDASHQIPVEAPHEIASLVRG